MIDLVTKLDATTKFFYLDLDKEVVQNSPHELYYDVIIEDATHSVSVTHVRDKNSVAYSFIQHTPEYQVLIDAKLILMTPKEFENNDLLLKIVMSDIQREIKKEILP